MRKYLVLAAIAALGVSSALATPIWSDGNGVTLHADPIDAAGHATRDVGIIYDSLAFEGNITTTTSSDPNTGISEDYVSIATTPSTLAVYQFVGGVESDNEVAFFAYYDTAGTFVDSFGVRFPSGGLTFIWTITLSDPTSVDIPNAGFLVMYPDDGTNNPDGLPGTIGWRYKDVAPAIGTTTGDVYRMTMDAIPEPASLLLLGLAGLVIRRR